MPEANSQLKPELSPDSEPEAMVVDTKPALLHEVLPDQEPESTVETKLVSQLEISSDGESEFMNETKLEPELSFDDSGGLPDRDYEVIPDHVPKSIPDPVPGPAVEAKPVSDPELSARVPELASEGKPAMQPEGLREPVLKANPASQPEGLAEPAFEAKSASQPEVQPDQVSERTVETKAESKTEPSLMADSVSDSGPGTESTTLTKQEPKIAQEVSLSTVTKVDVPPMPKKQPKKKPTPKTKATPTVRASPTSKALPTPAPASNSASHITWTWVGPRREAVLGYFSYDSVICKDTRLNRERVYKVGDVVYLAHGATAPGDKAANGPKAWIAQIVALQHIN